MNEKHKDFLKKAEIKAFDKNHRKIINHNISKYDAAVLKGKQQFSNLAVARQRVSFMKHRAINNLENHLKEFEYNFVKNGGKVIWATDAAEAAEEILKIFIKNEVKMAVKSKSMATEEIELNHKLESNHIESVETDLGEYIVQIAGERPYHIITPAMHKSKEDIARLFHEKFNTPEQSTPEELTAFVRQILREKFTKAKIGVTGANFILADIGGIALTENEGNALMTVSFPKIHIVIAGIDKIIPSVKDLALLWPVLASHGTGQYITVYNSIITGPRKENETDGPEEMYVVLLDNGRSNLLNQKQQKSALTCIRCGACLNACPIYRNIGGHTYETVYSGPIGSVITPYMRGLKDYKHLSFASSLCGKCTEVCPSAIKLHKLLLYNRRDTVNQKMYGISDTLFQFGWRTMMLNRWIIDKPNAKLKNTAIRMFVKYSWGKRRDLPLIKDKSFNRWWKDKKGIK
ncbi:MAG TPA: lactate utilization protein B [Bacteroidales bacterium]|nr:lactate utilization protein [Bacteroidales bacterium]HNZ43173.1 lactate utilization protein B [Bacteroidales bacterium]HPB25444.1 lactate utilization protein B [Bacteroidales bacterium]HPI30640.1 lactate utilization protein B [Bacteroidales bacterium]HQN16690.1 lactate utilization protein B [Bacteroidales bacterium]